MIESLQRIGQRISTLFGEPSLATQGTAKNGKEMFDACTLSQFLPYEDYDEEHGVFFCRGSIGFAIEAYALPGSEEAQQKEIDHLFEDILEEGASIQCILFADHRIGHLLNRWRLGRRSDDPVLNEISDRRSQFLSSSKQTTTRQFRFVFSYSMPLHEEATPHLLKTLCSKKEKILQLLNGMSHAWSWTPQNLLEFTGVFLNFSFDTDRKQPIWNPYQVLSEQMTKGGILRVHEDGLEWGQDITFKTFRVVDYPSSWSLGLMQNLIGDAWRDHYRLNVPFYLHYSVHCPKQGKAEREFWQRSQLIEKQGRSHSLLRMIPELDAELKESMEVRQALTQGARFVWTRFSVGMWAKKEKIAQSEQVLNSLFRLNQFSIVPNHFLHLPQLLADLPIAASEYVSDLKGLNLFKTTLTSECGNFIPVQGEWQGTSPRSGMLLAGRRGQLMNWNPFDNRSGNYNVVVSGRSGSGKSVFMQELLVNGLSTGANVFVLEVGRSFEKLCHLLNGQAIEFSQGSPVCLNPFSIIPAEDEEARDLSFSCLKSVITCMASPTKGTTDYENSAIERAIRQAWDLKKNQATITDIAHWLESQEDTRARSLAMVLTPYTKEGLYSRYFEGKNNVSFTNPMVWIELEELKDKKDLQAVVMQLFILSITNQAFLGDRKTPFYICIDEAWDLLRGSQTGAFIETLARRLRKYNGSLVIGTQGIDDFFATPGAQAAFENSDWMCLLAHKKSAISNLVQSGKLKFSGAQQKAMESVTTRQGEFSEVMICDANGGYTVTRLVLDPFSQFLYSTKADEYSRVKELQASGLTLSEAIHKLVEEREKH